MKQKRSKLLKDVLLFVSPPGESFLHHTSLIWPTQDDLWVSVGGTSGLETFCLRRRINSFVWFSRIKHTFINHRTSGMSLCMLMELK